MARFEKRLTKIFDPASVTFFVAVLAMLKIIKALTQSLVLFVLAGSLLLYVAMVWLESPISIDNRKTQAMLILSTSATGSKGIQWIVPAKTTANAERAQPKPISCFGEMQQGENNTAKTTARPVRSL